MTHSTDGFTSITSALQLSDDEVNILRAYYRYILQLGQRFEETEVVAVLTDNPALTRGFVEFFAASFNPEAATSVEDRLQARAALGADFSNKMQQVAHPQARQILQAYAEVLQATVRTNFYQRKETVAFKLRPTEISFAPLPRPMWEIWVYSEKVEGTHLRFGMVSRGGLRWSDRPHDFRTEVLGLVKAQRVKNSVIIPNGSKGGFFPKGLPDRDAEKDLYAQMGVDAY